MIKHILSWLCGLVIFFSGPNAHVKAPVVRQHGYRINHAAVGRAKEFTVLISNEGFGGISRGTGILIDEGHVLTCAHVVANGNDETLVYFFPSNFYATAKPVFRSSSMDLAILELSVEVKGAPVPVFQEAHFDGEPITIIGNILGSMKWFVAYGIVSGENDRDLYTDGLVMGGDSGGPWINDRGEVVALSDWGMENGDGVRLGISGGISAKTIHEFLKEWKAPSIFDILFGKRR